MVEVSQLPNKKVNGKDRINVRRKNKDAMYIDEISIYMASLFLYNVFTFHRQSMKSQSFCHFLDGINELLKFLLYGFLH